MLCRTNTLNCRHGNTNTHTSKTLGAQGIHLSFLWLISFFYGLTPACPRLPPISLHICARVLTRKAGEETWVLLDSKLPAPEVVGSLEEALAQLRLFLQRGASVYTVKRRQPRTQEEDGEGEEQVEAQGKEKEGGEDKDGAGQEERKGFCNAEKRGEKARKYNNTTSTPEVPNEISTSLDAFNDNGTTSSLHVS